MALVSALDYLEAWLQEGLPPDSRLWLRGACEHASEERALFLAFALAPRKVPRSDLVLEPARRSELERAFPGWRAWRWSLDQVARCRLLLALPAADPQRFVATLDRLFAAAGLQELVALYQALPLLPHGPALVGRAAEGVRSSMSAVFSAVALDNAYPARHLNEAAWNQMVLKCLFVGADLTRVVGLDERANPALMRMLCDYAHERWAAKRLVDPLLWRGVGRHADGEALGDLQRVLREGTAREQSAAALALCERGTDQARLCLAPFPALEAAYARGELTWEAIATP
jgi:hypothetical protein